MKRFIILALISGLIVQAAPALAELKIAYIDSEVLREQLPEFKAAQRKLEQLRQEREREAIERESKLRKLEEDFRKQELLMSETRKQELRAQFEEKMREHQEAVQKTFGTDGELMKKNIELSTPIFEQINEELKEMGEEEGYDFIFDVGANSTIVYTPAGKYDITEKLIERLREKSEEQEGDR